MTAVAVIFNADQGPFAGSFADLHADGYRLRSVSLFGPRARPIYAGLWHQTWGPEQALEPLVQLGDLDAVISSHRAEGRYPALVSAIEASLPVLAIVFEESFGIFPPEGGPGRFPTLLKPTTWSWFTKAVYESSLAFHVRSVAILGPRRNDPAEDGFSVETHREPESDRVQANPHLTFAATFWPNRPSAPPAIASGVRLSTAAPDWRWQWSNMAMRNHSEVVAVVGAPTTNQHPEPVLTLWHDVMHEPWPEPDPFLFDPHQQGERHRIDREGIATVASAFEVGMNAQQLPISLTAHGESAATAVWHTVWAPRTAWQPLPRKLVRVGPGDGTDRLDPEGAVVRSFTVVPSGIQHAGATMVRDLTNLYEEQELRPGHVRLVSRLAPALSSTLRRRSSGRAPEAESDRFRGHAPPGSPAPGRFDWHGPSGGGPGTASGGLGAQTEPEVYGRAPGLVDTSPGASFGWHPFDSLMQRLLRRGARAGYLVVLRGGELKFVRAYTLAEAGYRITRLHHRFRIASVSKPILATLLVRQFNGLPGGLHRNFAAELGVTPVFPQLGRATISDALRHATGLTNTYSGPLTYDTILRYANGSSDYHAKRSYLESLGTMRKWYERYDDPAGVPYQEREIMQYNNWVYSCLGEVFANRSPWGNHSEWPRAIADALRESGCEDLESVFAGRSYADSLRNGEVSYHSRPAVSTRRWPKEEEPLPFTATPYGVEVDACGTATSIVISPIDMARFLAAMTPRLGRFHWLDPAWLGQLHLGDPRIEGNVGIGWGSGGQVSWTSHRTGAPLTFPVVRMQHAGALAGCQAWVEHRKSPVLGAPPNDPDRETDTVSVAMAFNRENIIYQPDVDEAFRIAQDLEIAGGWAAGDLLDDL